MIIQHIRTGRISKVIACYLAMQLVLTTIQPSQLFALTSGPSQPEFNAFTPIGTSDMVNLSTGDFNYNIPIMDVGGYPLNLAYDAGITMDQEASWVGLGWNLSVGQINRNVRGIPDDFKGDSITYENNMKKNKTVGMTLSINGQLSGTEPIQAAGSFSGNASITLLHNNYEGFSFSPSFGVSYQFAKNTSVGMNLAPSVENGASVSPTIGFSENLNDTRVESNESISQNYGVGLPYNSRQGISAFNINTSTNRRINYKKGYSSTLSGASRGISFVDNTFTPTKRVGYHNENYTFRASLGPQLAAFSFEGGVSAFYSVQKIKKEEKIKEEKTYGYEFTKEASHKDILDFNRENERMVTKNTLALPVTNYTYDIYQIQGQGIAGQFRPFKGQTGYVFNQKIEDSGDSFSLGGEIEGGWGFRNGVDIHYSPTRSHTGVWNTPAIHKFQSVKNTELDYEETYFKAIGDLSADLEEELYNNELSGESPMALDLEPNGNKYNKKAISRFNVKKYTSANVVDENVPPVAIDGPLKRTKRERRNQAIQKINKKEASFDPFISEHDDLKPHHTNGMKITQPSGAVYVYGEAAVNHTKEEVTFGANGIVDLETGTITVNGNDYYDSAGGFDEYFNKITTPDYAHTYLLSAVLSNDYEDLTGDGPTDDDLGAYTKIHYNDFTNDTAEDGEEITSLSNVYKWSVPYNADDVTPRASYNPGLYTKTNDQKGSYVRGEKELKYATMIETKTHVATFDFSNRKDAKGTGNSKMLRLNKIRLYSKPEYQKLINGDTNISPIKTAHFEYDYSLAPETPNSEATTADSDDGITSKGKLTLKKIYFTYRNSKMGKYTPYVFNYDNYNPNYQMKSYDIWGNYKPLFEDGVTYDEDANGNITSITLPDGNTNANCEVQSDITAQEFPFVQQKDKALQNYYTSAWTLSSIDLPSGGRIELQYESDDYQYIQDKKAMQMFKVKGVSDQVPLSLGDVTKNLYTNGQHAKYLVVELSEAATSENFKEKYLGEYADEPLFFRFLVNMTRNSNNPCAYDYVEGYCMINEAGNFSVFTDTDDDNISKKYGVIPIQLENQEGGNSSVSPLGNGLPLGSTNPIAKSGWFFARKHLNRYAYGTGDNTPSSTNIGDIVNAIGSSLPVMLEIFDGPNGYLERRRIARTFVPEKSWIRLQHPTNAKLGGGLRVKKVIMHDNWDVMIENPQSNSANPYSNFYGQEYDYTLGEDVNGNSLGSSGVATWEPNMSKENPLIQPFFDDSEKLQAREYVEKPFGKSFYPSATVTYSKVTVKNLQKTRLGENNTELVVKRHATGEVVNEYFTSKDFPTKSDHTDIDDKNNYRTDQENILDNVLRLSVRTELALSQGFSIITNDMNGKSKSQKIYDENKNLISGVDYVYNVNDAGELDNYLPVILSDGHVETKEIGTHYDVITDFNENYNLSESYGVNANLTFFNVGIIPIILGQMPFEYKRNETTLHTTTTTKIIHKTGILKEKVAYDLGASVSTRNLAWDAVSGQVLLTETSNAYDDNYYNFTYPAHWAYKGMGQAVQNLGISLWVEPIQSNGTPDASGDQDGATAWYKQSSSHHNISFDLDKFLNEGDEIYMYNVEDGAIEGHYWINEISPENGMIFIDGDGSIVNACGSDSNEKLIKVIRSSYRNLQSATMASVTVMRNPIGTGDDVIEVSDFAYGGTGMNPRIINASAIKYKNYWRKGVKYPSADNLNSEHLLSYPKFSTVNPFINNVLGDWRAVKSYAYLTTRSSTDTKRNSGFFETFSPFYTYDSNLDKWVVDDTNWTFASEVTQYSPYGAELENRDALGRYSSAQYDSDYKLPLAVASNSNYTEMGYTGFEMDTHHFNFSQPSGVIITEEESHTGRYSIKVPAGSFSGQRVPVDDGIACIPTVAVETLDCSSTDPFICPTIPDQSVSLDHDSFSGSFNIPSLVQNHLGGHTIIQLRSATVVSDTNNPNYVSLSIDGLNLEVNILAQTLPNATATCRVGIKLDNGEICSFIITVAYGTA